MKLLLDTHTLLWFFSGNSNISPTVRLLIEDTQNQKLISVASIWEMAIKQSQSKLDLKKSASDYVEEKISFDDFELLPIQLNHLRLISTLPFYHRDPFDRLLIAQSIAEQVPILSKDKAFDQYSVARIWNNNSMS
jgi:PIN domain nuclease of toxin-antitoxin system